jgi:hypothetical protein
VALAVADFANTWRRSFCSCRAFALRNNAFLFWREFELLRLNTTTIHYLIIFHSLNQFRKVLSCDCADTLASQGGKHNLKTDCSDNVDVEKITAINTL